MSESSHHTPGPEELPSLDFPWKTAGEALEYRSRLDFSASRSEQQAAATFDDMLDDLFQTNPALATEITLRMAASDTVDMRSTAAAMADLLYAADKETGWQLYIRLFDDDDWHVRETAVEEIEMGVEEGLMTEEEAKRLKDAYQAAERRREEHEQRRRFFGLTQRVRDGGDTTPPSAPDRHP
jgi:hypothetical protein